MTTRRAVIDGMLGLAGAAPFALVGLASRAGATDPAACVEPEKLSASAKSLRNALGFVTPAPDPAKACGGCAFFVGKTPASNNGCGTCGLLSGGPVTTKSWCRSWAKKG